MKIRVYFLFSWLFKPVKVASGFSYPDPKTLYLYLLIIVTIRLGRNPVQETK